MLFQVVSISVFHNVQNAIDASTCMQHIGCVAPNLPLEYDILENLSSALFHVMWNISIP